MNPVFAGRHKPTKRVRRAAQTETRGILTSSSLPWRKYDSFKKKKSNSESSSETGRVSLSVINIYSLRLNYKKPSTTKTCNTEMGQRRWRWNSRSPTGLLSTVQQLLCVFIFCLACFELAVALIHAAVLREWLWISCLQWLFFPLIWKSIR